MSNGITKRITPNQLAFKLRLLTPLRCMIMWQYKESPLEATQGCLTCTYQDCPYKTSEYRPERKKAELK